MGLSIQASRVILATVEKLGLMMPQMLPLGQYEVSKNIKILKIHFYKLIQKLLHIINNVNKYNLGFKTPFSLEVFSDSANVKVLASSTTTAATGFQMVYNQLPCGTAPW